MKKIGIVDRIRFATEWPDRNVPRAIGSEWKRSIAEAAEHDRLGEDPAHQELLVAAAARHADRAAEHVGEQQHEDDRLDRRVRQRLRLAADVLDAAAGDHPRVRGVGLHGTHAATSCSCGSQCWPVSVRNASSSVG
jgi:hypothetical protein